MSHTGQPHQYTHRLEVTSGLQCFRLIREMELRTECPTRHFGYAERFDTI